jgi:predicted PurR-regulated permease PerM
MASKHVKQVGKPRVSAVLVLAFVALAFAAISAAAVVPVVSGDATAARTPDATPAMQQPISQEGRLVAVSPTSVTAQSVDGFARTYVIDAQTNAITTGGSLVGGAASAFAVNDEVAIVGVVRDGTAVATAVAAKQVSNLNGPPMDGF